MNEVNRTPSLQAGASPADDTRRLIVSALVDGEVSPSELEALLRDDEADAVRWDDDWATYQWIGEALRGASAVPSARASADFAAAVSQRLRHEALPVSEPAEAVAHVRGAAANDSVFRWKLAAGLASLAAVAAVGWNLVGRGGPAAAPAEGAQMAQVSPASPVAEAPVVVQTVQGQMLRDARLEQLLSEHRQYGGMSALQTSTGFLRNATYDSSPQR